MFPLSLKRTVERVNMKKFLAIALAAASLIGFTNIASAAKIDIYHTNNYAKEDLIAGRGAQSNYCSGGICYKPTWIKPYYTGNGWMQVQEEVVYWAYSYGYDAYPYYGCGVIISGSKSSYTGKWSVDARSTGTSSCSVYKSSSNDSTGNYTFRSSQTKGW